MKTFSCQSGSNGNCIFVQAGRTRLLIDAGISGKKAQERMAARDEDIRRVDAVLLSHDHIDHTRAAGIYHRKFGLPVYATKGTWRACRLSQGRVGDVRLFDAGESLTIGEATIHTISTPHDGADGVCFVVEHDGRRLGVLTDLGFVFDELPGVLATLDATYLESNYDPQMLRNGPYPPRLQRRIRGNGGHLSNAEAASLLAEHTDGRLQWATLAHLSEHNNTPQLALQTARRIIARPLALHVASRYAVSHPLPV